MFKQLLTIHLLGAASSMFTGRIGKRIWLVGLLLALCGVGIALVLGVYFSTIAGIYSSLGLGWFYFFFYCMLSFVMMFIMTVFMTQSQLYGARDNKFLLSMPIPARTLLNSRIAALLLENEIYGLLAAVPALFVWFRDGSGLGFSGVVAFILITLALPFLSFALSGIFGWLLHKILVKTRHSTLVGTLFGLAFLICYFAVFLRANTITARLLTDAGNIADSLSFFYWLGAAISEGNVVYLVIVLLIIAAVFTPIYLLLSKTYLRAVMDERTSTGASNVHWTLRESSAPAALLKKEFSRLFSSTAYILNAGMGAFMLVCFAVILVIKRELVLRITDVLGKYAYAGIAALLAFLQSMNLFSASSISLEGKSIQVCKSLPLKSWTILKSKIRLHVIMTVPVGLLVSTVVVSSLNPDIADAFAIYLLPSVYAVLMAYLGLVVNLLFPKLDWQSETQAVKQGMSVAICMFGGVLLIALPVALYALALNGVVAASVYALVWTALYAAMAVALRAWAATGGVKRFETL